MTEQFYLLNEKEVFSKLKTSERGLSDSEVKERIKNYGLNEISKKDKRISLLIFLSQFKSPLILILLFASIVAYFLGEVIDSIIILSIIFMNSLLGFYQEFKSEKALKTLEKYISFKAKVLRDGEKTEIDIKELVPGDIVFLNIGDIVPADIRLIESQEIYANESTVTGESNPVGKTVQNLRTKNLSISKQTNILFMGSIISSGLGKGIVISTGKNTEFGKTATILSSKVPPSDFEKGIKNFGNFLIKIVFYLTIFIFAANALLGKGILNSFLFALALAVGITPELLPIIITISLSRGAAKMAEKKVIVKKLASIENLGNMDILCTDKTGTLTENKVNLDDYFDIDEKKTEEILKYSILCNSAIAFKGVFEGNVIDKAILEYADKEKIQIKDYKKIEDIEFSYERKRMSSILEKDGKRILVSKGSPLTLFEICNYLKKQEKIISIKDYKKKLNERFKKLSLEGFRVIAVAYKEIKIKKDYNEKDENNMVFLGFITLLDPPKKDVKKYLDKIKNLEIDIKVLTGDNEFITETICKKVGLKIKNRIICGDELEKMNKSEFISSIEKNNIFARISPEQKFMIVSELNKRGHVVGFLGDGVNDAPALRAADVGISVDSAVDVAKDSSDIILLKKNLGILAEGIYEGRKTFGNTTKYILNTTSAHFGNMLTLSISSLYFNFIPLLPSQILLTNFITDVPLATISTDNVDEEYFKKPKKWNIKFISKFMIFFGLISSIFDIVTMVLIWFILAPGNPKMFRTIWFTESVLSEIVITFSIRTRKSFLDSKPSKSLIYFSILGIAMTFFAIYFSPLRELFYFNKLNMLVLGIIFLIILAYFLFAEIGKIIFYSKVNDYD